MEIEAEVMRYKKKAQKKPSPKAKHKHDYQPCIIRTDNIALHSNFGIVRVPKGKLEFGSYCTVCGKIGSVDFDRWYRTVKLEYGVKPEHTEEALRELNPSTRTIPTFYVTDTLSQKFVNLEETET